MTAGNMTEEEVRDFFEKLRSQRQDSAVKGKSQEGGAVMEAVWFIFGAFVGSIVAVFTLSLFLVNGRKSN